MGLKPRVPELGTLSVLTLTVDSTYATADMTTPTADGLWISGPVNAPVQTTASPRLEGTPGIEE